MGNIPTGTEIESSYRDFVDSRFISSIDIMGKGDIVVEIHKVEHHPSLTFENKKTVTNKILLYVKGKDKPLVMCKTNLLQIATALKTPDVKAWKGRKVTMFAEAGTFFGKDQFAVRFRTGEVKS